MTLAELRQAPGIDLTEQYYVLRERDGDYVEEVQSTGMETVKLFFTFTKDLEKAHVFTSLDLFWKQASIPVGIEFSRGFAGGRAIPLRKRQ